MKRTVLFLLFLGFVLFCSSAQTTISKEDPFNGTSAQAAEWIESHDQAFRRIASGVSKVIAYSGRTNASGDGVTLLFYDYRDLSVGQIGTVLEIIDNSSGNIIYVVWTNEAFGNNAVFRNDYDKHQLDVSVASRGRRYGMSNDTLKYVRTIVAELR